MVFFVCLLSLRLTKKEIQRQCLFASGFSVESWICRIQERRGRTLTKKREGCQDQKPRTREGDALADDVHRLPSKSNRSLLVSVGGQFAVHRVRAGLRIVHSSGLALGVPLHATMVGDIRTATVSKGLTIAGIVLVFVDNQMRSRGHRGDGAKDGGNSLELHGGLGSRERLAWDAWCSLDRR